jgi:asparagine synthase (glutamine-hydrolysing)
MRQHVTVALSGDGGDEGFGGYNFYWWIAWIARWRTLPVPIWHSSCVALSLLARLGVVSDRLPQRLGDLANADDTSIIQNLFCWVREREHNRLCQEMDVLPVSRLFEPHWDHRLPPGASRLERLTMQATEANIRLMLANDFLFKVDIASMKEKLEVRVPMLDEDLFDFALSLPHSLKVKGQTCKRVLRTIAQRKLPPAVANKRKCGFMIPVDTWVDSDCQARLRAMLLGPSSMLPEFFRPEAYRPMVEAFCDGHPYPGISREGLYRRAIMLLSVQLALDNKST